MNLTTTQRLTKLAGNLAANPGLIPKYFKHNILPGKRLPMDLGYPWWSYNAIKYADTIVEGKKIFEYGTGGSTIRFSKKAKSVVAVEDDIKWAELMRKRLKELNIKNAEINYCSYNFHEPDDFENSDYLKMVAKDDFDIIIIDGQDYTFRERIKCFRYAEPLMKPGQYIIVDDYWRYEELSASNKAKDVKVFESVGPCRYGVTSTAVFSY
jgi:predicted O-methyltransferase YrrM